MDFRYPINAQNTDFQVFADKSKFMKEMVSVGLL